MVNPIQETFCHLALRSGSVFFFFLAALSLNPPLSSQTLTGEVSWDGPCGVRVDGSTGGAVCGFQIRVFGPNKGLLGEKFLAVNADDPLGCAHYQTNIFDLLPANLRAQDTPPLVTVLSVDCDGIASPPSQVYADLLCPGAAYDHSGDANRDGGLDISDAILLLTSFFQGGRRPCYNSADFNKDKKLDLSDPIAILAYQFLGKLP